MDAFFRSRQSLDMCLLLYIDYSLVLTPPLRGLILIEASRQCRFLADILAKVFLGWRTKIPRAADAFMRGDVRDHIVSSKIDPGPP